MFGFLKRKIKKEEKASSISLKEFVELRKNKKTVYSDEDVINYCLELFKNDFIECEKVRTNNIKALYSKTNRDYDYIIWIELEDVYKKFVGLTIIDILNIIKNDKDFNNKLENLMKDWIGRDVLKEITYKTEFKFSDVKELIEREQRIRTFGRTVDALHAGLHLYFKYD